MSYHHSLELIAAARALWDEGLSVRRIGKLIGISHNSVSSMAQTHGFTPRPPNALIERMRAAMRGEYHATKVTKVSAQRVKPRNIAQAPKPMLHNPRHIADVDPNSRAYFPLKGGCQWIDGEPSMYASMCGEDRVKGRPYCRRHCARAYQAPKPGIEKLRVR